jgi:hypothetical protein
MTDYERLAKEAEVIARANGRDPLELAGVLGLQPGCDLGEVAGALRLLAPHLTGLDPLGQRELRGRAIAALEDRRVKGAAGWVDAALTDGASRAPGRTEPAPDAASLRQGGAPVLEAGNVLELVGDYVAKAGYAGSVTAPKVIYLSLTSRLLDRPVNLAVTGQSAVGKNHAVRTVLPLFPKSAYHEVTGASPLALIYNPESFAHRMVIVAESSALHHEGVGASMIRGLAWDHRLVYETVIDGKHVQLNKPGPTGLITTSTRDLDRELATRLWTVAIADTRQQTRAVLGSLARSAGGTALPPPDTAPFVAAQRWLEAQEGNQVIVPYAERLAGLLPDREVRLRRDFTQLLNLVRAHALLHRVSRRQDPQGRVIADIADYMVVRDLVAEMFTATVGVAREIRETVEAVVALLDGRPAGSTVTVTEVEAKLDLAYSTTWDRVKRAVGKGLLVNSETRKRHPAQLRIGEIMEPESEGLPRPELLVSPFPGDDRYADTSPVSGGPDDVLRVSVNVSGGDGLSGIPTGPRLEPNVPPPELPFDPGDAWERQ